MSENLLTKQNVLQVAEEFSILTAERNLEMFAEPIRERVDEYQLGIFRLLVVGEYNKGKSSFINALLGEPNLLPIDIDATTSTVYKVIYGDTKKYKVFFNPEDLDRLEDVPPPLEITEAQVAEYGTEAGNLANEKGVDFISVQLPNPLLKSGLVIIDTPGLGGLVAEHGEIVWRNAPTADAVCFVLDSVESEMTQPEIEGLKKVLEIAQKFDRTPPLFFVQTKIDRVTTEEAQQYRDRNLEIISEHLDVPKEKLDYFPVGSVLKETAEDVDDSELLQNSGFPELYDFFSGKLIIEKEKVLAHQLLGYIREATLGTLQPSIISEVQIFETEGKEELAQLTREAGEIQKGFTHWEQQTYPQIVKDFNDSANALRRNTHSELQNELEYGSNSPIVMPIISDLETKFGSAKALVQEFGNIQVECIEVCQELAGDILEKYGTEIQSLVQQKVEELGSSFDRAIVSSSDAALDISIQERLRGTPSFFRTVREIGYGGVFGMILVQYALPFLYLVVGPIMVIAAFLAWRDFKKSTLQSTLEEIQRALLDIVRRAQMQAIQQFSHLAAEGEQRIRDLLEGARKNMAEELKRRRAAISESQKLSRQEKKEKTDALAAEAKQVENLIDRINSMLSA